MRVRTRADSPQRAQVEAADLEAGLVALLQAQAALSAADVRCRELLRSLDQARSDSTLHPRSARSHGRCAVQPQAACAFQETSCATQAKPHG